MDSHAASRFKSLEYLSEWIVGFLLLEIVVAVGAIASEAYGLSLINEIRFGGDEAIRLAEAVDSLQSKIAWGQSAIILLAGVLVLVWIYRMNKNARALGAEGMKFTPGWAVGWYFIPIANLWKPYQALKEIWQASAKPGDWAAQYRSPLLPCWWGLWIVYTSLAQGAYRTSRRVENLEDLKVASWMWMASDFSRIAVDAVFILLVIQMTTLQRASASHHDVNERG